jgi:hypothetical protein
MAHCEGIRAVIARAATSDEAIQLEFTARFVHSPVGEWLIQWPWAFGRAQAADGRFYNKPMAQKHQAIGVKKRLPECGQPEGGSEIKIRAKT